MPKYNAVINKSLFHTSELISHSVKYHFAFYIRIAEKRAACFRINIVEIRGRSLEILRTK